VKRLEKERKFRALKMRQESSSAHLQCAFSEFDCPDVARLATFFGALSARILTASCVKYINAKLI
jgi:hypothetical protein